jgi:hypothetical protein
MASPANVLKRQVRNTRTLSFSSLYFAASSALFVLDQSKRRRR